MSSKPEERAGADAPVVPICAIGASAGGVTALRTFFRLVPADLGLAYVVILHLSPEHPSAMAEILATCTQMSVHQVDDDPALRPNCVYVIPPDRELVIEGNSVQARPFSEPRGQRAPIDLFFRSIAAARGDGMAVVLSGSGSDGSVGVKAVHEGGGVIFVQAPSDAQFPMMPQNAIATGVANFVGPVHQLVERISEVARSKEAVRSLDADGASNDLRRIIGFLRARTGHDFSSYKRATVMRRVRRRMQVCRLASLGLYADHLRVAPEEAQELFADLLISVTQFFRDEAAFTTLARQGVGPIFDDLREEGLRAWVVGCATGEEAYSLAILLLEEAERRKVTVPIQIFASDLDEGALATAREARYPRSIEADVSEARLARFFVDEGSHFRIRKEVRDLVLFASHSVVKDPPFLRLDLVTCRNLLIYLERPLQQQLVALFHYALVPHGLLFLGSAETVGASPQFFLPIDREARLYRARPNVSRQLPRMPHHPGEIEPFQPTQAHVPVRERSPQGPGEMHVAALERHAPPSVLVDGEHHVLHLSATAGRFIKPSGGQFTSQLPLVVRPELRLDLQVALDRALQRNLPTTTPTAVVAFDGPSHHVSMNVLPAPGDHNAKQALVLFLDGGPVPDESLQELEAIESRPDEMRRLHAELRSAQQALVTIRNEHEVSIQELRAANEEFQSVNEEYRSTAEELETSKEELQSMNEELQTVNTELKSKLQSISTAHSDLQNLTAATEIGTLFLDTELRIRMFARPVADLFNVTEPDIGRAITDFTHRLAYDGVEHDARQVLRDLTPREAEVQTQTGRWFMMRLRPYRTIEDRIDGTVLTFVDITARKTAERELFASELRYRTLFDSIDEGFCVVAMLFDSEDHATDYRFEEVNAAFERQTGLSGVVGKRMRMLRPDHEAHWFEHYGRVSRTQEPERFEAPAAALGRYYEVYAFPVGDPAQRRIGVLFRDISQRKEEEKHRELLTHELSHRVKNTLAVVQALANFPPGPQVTPAEYRKSFVGRIQALARAHGQLLETNWTRLELRRLVQETLGTYLEPGSDRAVLTGEPIRLSPRQGLSLALILHELATNAAKYGALSTPEGRLELTWTRQAGLALQLRWQERDGPPVMTPSSPGFGSKLIGKVVDYDLGGKADLTYHTHGVVCVLSFAVGD